MAGRIFAVLLTSEKEYMSADEIADYLHASRGSVSTMIRMLVQISLVKRVSVPGERKRYYQLSDPENMLNAGVVIMQHFIASWFKIKFKPALRGLDYLILLFPGAKIKSTCLKIIL